MEGRKGQEEKEITVFYHKPESFGKRLDVLMVIPGAGRNGDDYRDAWVEASEEYGVFILSQSYPAKYYPEYWSYNLAGMTREVTLDLNFTSETNPEEWTLDDAREEINSSIGMHELVGHAEGHQLVYQLVTFSTAGMLADVDIQGTSERAHSRGEWSVLFCSKPLVKIRFTMEWQQCGIAPFLVERVERVAHDGGRRRRTDREGRRMPDSSTTVEPRESPPDSSQRDAIFVRARVRLSRICLLEYRFHRCPLSRPLT